MLAYKSSCLRDYYFLSFLFFFLLLSPPARFLSGFFIRKQKFNMFVCRMYIKRCRERCYISKCGKTARSRNAFAFETFIFQVLVNYRKQEKKYTILQSYISTTIVQNETNIHVQQMNDQS